MSPFPRPRSGSALVITLLVIAVLAIIVVAFLQSMTIERQTARSYLERYKAELAAQAGQNEAIAKLARLMVENPYHGIGYVPGPGPAVGTAPTAANPLVPVLYGSASPTASPAPHYLVSGTTDQLVDSAKLNDTNSIKLNRTTDDASGWMGSPVDGNGEIVTRECRTPWVYILRDPANPVHQPDPSASGYNPYVARYAWWVEDETSKIDLLQTGNAAGAGGAFQPPLVGNLSPKNPNDTTNNTSYQDAIAWKPEHLDIGAIPILDGKPIASADTGSNKTLIDFLRLQTSRPKDTRILNEGPASFSGSSAKARFYTTLASVSNELAGNGRRRVNLNAIVHENSTSPAIITSDLDDIAYAITGTHIFTAGRDSNGLFNSQPDDNSKALLPNFGDRFWPSTDNSLGSGGTITNALKRKIYLTKIAANIRDYIDEDTNPTFVDRTGTVFAGSDPGNGGTPPLGTFPHTAPDGSRNNILQPYAIGKEAIPYLTKHAFSFTRTGSTLTFDQSYSFFNPSTKNFTAPTGTYLRGFERFSWNTGSFGSQKMPDYSLDLSGQVFEAGKVTVITTSPSPDSDPQDGSFSAAMGGPGRIARIAISPPNARSFTNVSGSATPVARGGSHDWYTQMLWGNPNGYYGGYSGITATALNNYSMPNPTPGTTTKKSTVTTMRGNDAPSHTGDARSLEEPLALQDPYLTGSSPGSQDQYRFYSSSENDPLATAYNRYIIPQGNTAPWPDYTPQFNNTIDTAYAIIRDQAMTSIGELGHIYDPYRRNGSNTAGSNGTGYIDCARGGGRTLRIGQPDDVITSGTGTPASLKSAAQAKRFTYTSGSNVWTNAAWRLTDVFDVLIEPSSDPSTPGLPNRTLKLIPPQASGKLNINSVMRDGGTALRTLLRGFKYLPASPHTDATITTKVLTNDEIDRIVAAVKSYLTYDATTNKGPMVERGEISQLFDATADVPIFSDGTLGTKKMTTIRDRAREEVFRRLIGMLTTRSSSYTIYTMGQSLREFPKPGGGYYASVTGTTTKATTYRFDPVISGKTGSQILDTNATDAATDYRAVPLYTHP